MLIVTGAVIARPGSREALAEAALAHVHRSRAEPGCLSHHVLADLDDPDRLVFLEHWDSRAALQAHAEQVGTRGFLAAVRDHAAEVEPLTVYDAAAVPL